MGSVLSVVTTLLKYGLPMFGVIAFAVVRMFQGMYNSILPVEPTNKQLQEENLEKNLLFKYIPALHGKIAWREIGNYPTPVHKCEVKGVGTFYVKREDLADPRYGGNKVRTLQHQLAACEAHVEKNSKAKFFVVGSGGSNQVIATTVHALTTFGVPIEALWMQPDAPDIDNTLNMLSVLSFPVASTNWTQGFRLLSKIREILWSKTNKIFNLGGNNVTGVLGQIGAVLELAEQIQDGAVPDPEGIYLASGSFCTFTGLLMGVVIARNTPSLDKAFRHPHFKIYAVPIHHAFAALQRNFGILKSPLFSFMPMLPLHGINSVSRYIVSQGGPDIKDKCVEFLHNQVDFVVDTDTVGIYGEHSKNSLKASQVYDKNGVVFNGCNEEAKPLWLCGHFAAKPFSVLVQKLRAEKKENGVASVESSVLFWQTKSNVQPHGPLDEFSKLKALAANAADLKRWVDEGEAHSALRPGKVDLDKDSNGYRHLMTEVKID